MTATPGGCTSPADVEADIGEGVAHYACGKCYSPSVIWEIGQVMRTRCGLVKPFTGYKHGLPECVVCRDLKFVYPCGPTCKGGGWS